MKNFVMIIFACVFLTVGCGPTSSSPDDYAIKYVGRQRLKASLRDPDSLQIISEAVVDLGGGEVGYRAIYRAKNGFGGYVQKEYYTE